MSSTEDIQSNARHAIGELEGILKVDATPQQIYNRVRDASVRIERIKELLTESGFRTRD